MMNGYLLYIDKIKNEENIIKDEICKLSSDIKSHVSLNVFEYENLDAGEKDNYKKNLIRLKKEIKKKEKLSLMLCCYFNKKYIANIIHRNYENVNLDNYEDICDSIVSLFDRKCSLDEIEILVKEILFRNDIVCVSDILNSIIIMFDCKGFKYEEKILK